MNIDDLIKKLTEIREKYGNIPVDICSDGVKVKFNHVYNEFHNAIMKDDDGNIMTIDTGPKYWDYWSVGFRTTRQY